MQYLGTIFYDKDLVTKEYVDNAISVNALGHVTSGATTAYLPLAGGIVTGVTQFTDATASTSVSTGAVVITGGLGVSGNIYGSSIWGAVGNDFAEFRQGPLNSPGRCVYEVGDDSMSLTNNRLTPGCSIISNTFGMIIGKTDKAQTPIAVAGRVLAYTFEPREEYKSNIGQFVCSGPKGTVSIMTKEEAQQYPESIIGTVSAVPDYDEWGEEGHKVKVDGRVWIRIK